MSEEVNWKRSFYKDGTLFRETPWVNNLVHGVEKYFYKDGTLEWEITWVNGEKHGIEKSFHKNGALNYEIPWVNDKINGVKKYLYEDETSEFCTKTIYVSGEQVSFSKKPLAFEHGGKNQECSCDLISLMNLGCKCGGA